MDRAMIFVGREGRIENYQLLIDYNCASAYYDGSCARELFYEGLSAKFVKRLLKENRVLEVAIFNGLRINTGTGGPERVSKLEDDFVAQLGEKIRIKYARVRQAIPAPSWN